MARLCRADNDLGSGVEVLDNFIKAKEQKGARDKDYADALYNRACYKLKLWAATKNDSFKEQTYRDLEVSISYSPAYKADAFGDEDFKELWKERRFERLGEVSMERDGKQKNGGHQQSPATPSNIS